MKTKYLLWASMLVLIFFIVTKPIAADEQTDEQKTIRAAGMLLYSTVIITTNEENGSGFYISQNEIVTNNHVVKESKSFMIKKSNGTQCLADVVFTQTDPDLALLHTDCEGTPLTLSDSVKAGQTILSMGDPMFNEFYVSKGVVGLLAGGRVVHDAITDQGSSGGPVVNLQGQLVGVSQSISTSTRISYAIDIKTLSYFLYQARGD